MFRAGVLRGRGGAVLGVLRDISQYARGNLTLTSGVTAVAQGGSLSDTVGYFNSSSSGGYFAADSYLDIGMTTHTFECRIKFPGSFPNAQASRCLGHYQSSIVSDGSISYTGGSRTVDGYIPSDNAWHHLAFVTTSGTSIKGYCDGTQIMHGTVSGNSANEDNAVITLGRQGVYYMEEMIYTLGAKWTTTFVPPKYLSSNNNSSAVLFVTADSRDRTYGTVTVGDKSSFARTPINPYSTVNASVSNIVDTHLTTAVRLDGFNGMLVYPYVGGEFDIQASAWTMEAWFNVDTVNVNNPQHIFSKYLTGGIWDWQWYVSDVVTFGHAGGGASITSGTITAKTWYHCAVVRTGGVITMYLNGVSCGTNSTTPAVQSSADPCIGALKSNASEGMSGDVSDVAYWNYAKYTSDFTPPGKISTGASGLQLLVSAR